MISVSAINRAPAIELLLQREPAGNSIEFIASDSFSTSLNGGKAALAAIFSGNGKVQGDYARFYARRVEVLGNRLDPISAQNSRHNAIVDTIIENRSLFPPEEFTIRVQYSVESWGSTTIPAASAADSFKADQAQRLSDFETLRTSQEAERSVRQSRNDLITQGKIIDSITLDAAERDQSANAALAILKTDEETEDQQAPLIIQTAFYGEI